MITLLGDVIGTPESEMLEAIGRNWEADAHDDYDEELSGLNNGESPRDAVKCDEKTMESRSCSDCTS